MIKRACVLCLAVFISAMPAQAIQPTPLDLSVAPNVAISGFNGEAYSLDQFKGHVVALHFWASWCVPCRDEVPNMARFINNNPDAVVLPVSVDVNHDSAARFLDSVNASMPLLFVPLSTARQFGVNAIPTTIILDMDGRKLYKISGAAPWGEPDFTDLLLGFTSRLP